MSNKKTIFSLVQIGYNISIRGGEHMATDSFLKEVIIENDREAERFAEALENAEERAKKDVAVRIPYFNASKEEIRSMFLGNK
jgi:hypothetical protein